MFVKIISLILISGYLSSFSNAQVPSDKFLRVNSGMAVDQNRNNFSNSNLKIIVKLGNVNSLIYLYEDLDFIYEFNAKKCPGLKNEFFINFHPLSISCSKISYRDFSFSNHAVLVKSSLKKAPPKKLLIYNHGHGGLPLKTDLYALELFNNLLDGGWDILFVSMPFTGLDKLTNSIKIRTADGEAVYDPSIMPEPFGGIHSLFELMDTGSSNYMRFFIDSSVINAIELQKQYGEISYLGLSGGATTGLYTCSALQDILKNCILVAGVMPSNLRLLPKTFGDAEQISSSFHLKNPVMKVVKEIVQSNTKLSLFYNSRDTCCFDDPSASQFKEMLRLNGTLQKINFEIRDSNVHGFDSTAISIILHNGAYN